MSNLIKYYNFNVTEDDKRLLEGDDHVEAFIPGILSHGEVEVKDAEREAFDEEFPEEMFENTEKVTKEVIDPDALLAEAHEQAGIILENAQAEAEKLLEQAKVTAEFEKEKVLEESRKAGYKDGLVTANDEVAAEKEELEQRREQLEQEYQQLVDELEPNFVHLVMGLVKKLTGVLVEDKKDIILYLMDQSLKNLGKTSSLVIHVSKEDISVVLDHQEKIREIVPAECEFEIMQDAALGQNQCILEADRQIIDCSLDVQMKGLLEDLKMIL